MKFNLGSQLQPPRLNNTNISLRMAKLADFEAIKSYRQDPENCRYIRIPEDDPATMKIVELLSQPWQLKLGQWNGLVICLNGHDTPVGEVVFNIEDYDCSRIELGYRMSTNVAGKGLCTQAATLLVDYLIKQLGVHKIVAKCDVRNIASYRVMEKLGFSREATFTQHFLIGDQWTDQYDYGLLASDWLKRSTLVENTE